MSTRTSLLNDEVIEEAVARYWREHDRYVKLATRVGDICRALMAENTIRAQVTYRAKNPDSLRGKLRKYKTSKVESKRLTSPEEIFARVGDLAGVRIATYEEHDREAVTRLLEGAFAGPGDAAKPTVEKKDKQAHDRSNFYRATHCQVVLPADELVGLYDNLKGLSCEVQVCSMLAHVWNEIEHDLRYKQLSGSLSVGEQDLIQQLGHLTIAGDATIRLLIAAVDKRQQSQQGEFTDAFDFVARLREKYPDLTEFGRHAQQLYEELRAHRVDSPAKVEKLIPVERIKDLQAALDEFHKWLQFEDGYRESGHLARMGADVLLMALLQDSPQKIMNRHPAGRGQGRPPRIAWLARRYQKMRTGTETSTPEIG